MFEYSRPIAYHETDAMGVVHHSNYIRLFEDCRVAYLRENNLSDCHYPDFDMTLAVLSVSCEHRHPLYFADNIKVLMQARLERLKIYFRYAIYSTRFDIAVAHGQTVHVPVNSRFNVCRLPKRLKLHLETEQWTETWP